MGSSWVCFPIDGWWTKEENETNVEHTGLKNGTSIIVSVRIQGIMRILTNNLIFNDEKFLKKDNNNRPNHEWESGILGKKIMF